MFKKILILFVCFNIISFPAYCAIEDDFVQKTLVNTQANSKKQPIKIEDSFVEKTLSKNLSIRKINKIEIQDTFAQNNTNKNINTKPIVDFAEQKIQITNQRTKIIPSAKIIDKNSMPIKISVKETFSTKQKINEGDYIEFQTLNDVVIKNKNYPKGTTVKARIETISLNKIWGVPSDLTIGSFSINENLLSGEINKTGANRSLWLYPTVYITTVFFGIGIFLIPIRGGHAKIKPKQVFVIYDNN